jgi:AcrR family transcriptional regulator
MSNLDYGRTNQKLRTHIALVECAAQFVRERKSFTVAEVADRAKVGRTTAYRYFPRVETLVAQASLYAATEVEQQTVGTMLGNAASVHDRLRTVVEMSDMSITDHDYLYRTMLRQSLNSESAHQEPSPLRSGVRKQLLDSAIGVLRVQLGEKCYEQLVASLSLFLGIEASVVLRDVCLLSGEEAREAKVWGANAILQAALAAVS